MTARRTAQWKRKEEYKSDAALSEDQPAHYLNVAVDAVVMVAFRGPKVDLGSETH